MAGEAAAPQDEGAAAEPGKEGNAVPGARASDGLDPCSKGTLREREREPAPLAPEQSKERERETRPGKRE